MTNNELQQIKDEHKKFYLIRKEIVGNSCKEVAENSKVYNTILSRVQNMEKTYSKEELEANYEYRRYTSYLYHSQRPSIRERALDDLEWAGYNKADRGTQYLATLITLFYHERKLYHRKDFQNKSYWNLEDWDNEHYGMMGVPKERVIYDILTANSHNPDLSCPFEETVYQIADSLGSRKYDESKRESVGYVDLLHKQQSTKKNNRH